MAGRHSSEFEYGSFNGDDGNDSPLTSEDEEEDKAYEESDSPEISDMDSD